ncbi:MAG: protein kinase, partial [Desulfobulbaceae bacterium]|nr:protein kinase [Desulfobulbaceae bacterium]
MHHLIGKHLGPYEILSIIGQGGMATVYKAYQANMDRHVALKVLLPHLTDDVQFSSRFQQEVKFIAKLEHPNILPVYDYGESDGLVYLVMRLVEGGSLSDLIRKGKQLPLATVSNVLAQIGSALDHSHRNGIIHRDIKPANILIDHSDNCLLTDFGIAKVAEANSNFTQTGHVVGTPSYISPELGRGEKVDQRSDIYSLGILLFQMLTGELPYHAETPLAIVLMHIQDPLPPLLSKRPDLSPEVEQVLFKALAKEADDRYSSTGELVESFKQALTTNNTTSAPVETVHNDNNDSGPTATIAMPKTKADAKQKKKKKSRKFHPKFIQFLFILCIVIIFSPYNYYQTIDIIDDGFKESGFSSYLDQKVQGITSEYFEKNSNSSTTSPSPTIPTHRQSTHPKLTNLYSHPGSSLPGQAELVDKTTSPATGKYMGGIISGPNNSSDLRLLLFTLNSSANG